MILGKSECNREHTSLLDYTNMGCCGAKYSPTIEPAGEEADLGGEGACASKSDKRSKSFTAVAPPVVLGMSRCSAGDDEEGPESPTSPRAKVGQT